MRDFFAALAGGDLPRVRALLHPEVVWTIIGDTPVSRAFRGSDDFAQGILGAVFAPIKVAAGVSVTLTSLIAQADQVVACAQGNIQGLYGPYHNTYCHVLTLREGNILANTAYLDTLLIERALSGRRLVERA